MSVESAPFYWLTCDGLDDDGTTCGIKSTYGGDYVAWDSPEQAREDAEAADWAHHNGKDYCDEHAHQFRCADCGEIKDECVCAAGRS